MSTERCARLEQFLQAVEIRTEAFGVCEIGPQFSLRCDPFDSVVVHFVVSGAGHMECRHGRFPLSAGMAVIVPKDLPKILSGAGPTKHVKDADAVCSDEAGLLRFRASEGEPGLVLACAQLSTSLGEELPLFDKAKRPILERSKDPLLRSLFATMRDELANPRLGTRAFVSSLMKQILIVLLRSQPDQDSATLLMSSARLAGVVAAILERPEENHSVASLAALAGMSRSRFSHNFVAAYDCSPTAFVQAVRLSTAARILKGSDLPVKSVAAAVGYASRSHFSRAFQAKFGVDPSGFRQASIEVADPIGRETVTAA